jgi:hypothetical protein
MFFFTITIRILIAIVYSHVIIMSTLISIGLAIIISFIVIYLFYIFLGVEASKNPDKKILPSFLSDTHKPITFWAQYYKYYYF